LSIIIVGVGKNKDGKFDKLAFLDGEEDEEGNFRLCDQNGNFAERDVVQFVPFREHKSDYKKYASELLEEIAPQIR
jgi:hypothetical protein